MAGLDGVLNKIDPGEPLDKNIYELPPEELKKVPNVAGSLGEAMDCLEKDHEYPAQGRRVHAGTSWTCGSRTSAKSTMRCACARIRTNSSCITTYKSSS